MTKIEYLGKKNPTDFSISVRSKNNNFDWNVPEELPVAFIYNQHNYAVMLATPDNLAELAIGFSVSESIVDNSDEIISLKIQRQTKGVELNITITPEKLERLKIKQRRRNLVGKAGCGMCGLDNAEIFFEKLPKVSKEKKIIKQSSQRRALKELTSYQVLGNRTKTVHAAGWAENNGKVTNVLEDIGRHNALDKLLGYILVNDINPSSGFVIISSRCSYEIIDKISRVGIKAISCISGPTAFAIRKAEEANISIYCQSSNDFVSFNMPLKEPI